MRPASCRRRRRGTLDDEHEHASRCTIEGTDEPGVGGTKGAAWKGAAWDGSGDDDHGRPDGTEMTAPKRSGARKKYATYGTNNRAYLHGSAQLLYRILLPARKKTVATSLPTLHEEEGTRSLCCLPDDNTSAPKYRECFYPVAPMSSDAPIFSCHFQLLKFRASFDCLAPVEI